jgi:ribosomal protein S18 acetylase RimI-like enzyme
MYGSLLSWQSDRLSLAGGKVKTIFVRDPALEIREILPEDLDAVLSVYQECEDFLALGPVATASLEMVLKDVEISREEGGFYCGIFTAEGRIVGVVDFVPGNYKGDPQLAYLSLLMIARSYRSRGIGEVVVEAVENEIKKIPQVKTILAGVQVNNPQAVRFWKKYGYQIISGPTLMPDQTTVFGLRKDL